jgi:NAD(P)-dependent dehydrogenase (short-subunit alcohol dehydrogenase family)
MFDLSSKVALVTGAGQGVGAGIVRQLSAAGAMVAVNDVHADRAAATVAEVNANGGRAIVAPFDVADLPAVEAGVAAVVAELGPIDILVNNAGIPPSMRPVKFRDLPPEEWAPYIDVNLYGVLNCIKATVDSMADRGWGRIITISSGAGTTGLGIGVSIYAAGKGAGISFMRHLAVECGRSGVTANTLALGLMFKENMDRTVTSGLERQIPAGRLGTGDDVGFACVYLASNEASWMNGQTIGLNGGSVTS